MSLIFENYADQNKRWPKKGCHILAQYDEESIIVYQAYNKKIGSYAINNGCFGGDFSFNRMSWIKPNFLWMMYRSGWGSKRDQEVTLAIRLKRSFFDFILTEAVASSYDKRYVRCRKKEWKANVKSSMVRLQWDPDHDPSAKNQKRKAIQIGMRKEILQQYSSEGIIEIIDMSQFVQMQRLNLNNNYKSLVTPKEEVYFPIEEAAINIGLK